MGWTEKGRSRRQRPSRGQQPTPRARPQIALDRSRTGQEPTPFAPCCHTIETRGFGLAGLAAPQGVLGATASKTKGAPRPVRAPFLHQLAGVDG